MSEHPTIRCPECGRGAKDVAPDYDPFAGWSGAVSVVASCSGGHRWLETSRKGERTRSGVVGTPGWAKGSPFHREKP